MKKRAKWVVLLCIALLSVMVISPFTASAATYSALIVKGNTRYMKDVYRAYQKINSNSNYNSPAISGWKLTDTAWINSLTGSNDRGKASDLVNAKNHTLLYWSGHGSKDTNTAVLSPSGSGSNYVGGPTDIGVRTTLGLNTTS